MLYLANAVLQLTRTVDVMAIRIRNIENASDPNHSIRFREFADERYRKFDHSSSAGATTAPSDYCSS
jgi:hypothetical protein